MSRVFLPPRSSNVRAECAWVEDRDGTLQSGMEAGGAETYDRLAEYLQTLS